MINFAKPSGTLLVQTGGTLFVISDTNSPSNDYAYNGKELNEDFGLNLSDYGARWYDAALGRWWSVDPLAEKYQGWSGYNYGMDNPVRFVDPDGRKVDDYIFLSYSGEELHRIKNDLVSQVTFIPDQNIDAFKEEISQFRNVEYAQSFGITYDVKSIEMLERKSHSAGLTENISATYTDGRPIIGYREASVKLSSHNMGKGLFFYIDILKTKIKLGENNSSEAFKSLNSNDAHYHPGPYVQNALEKGGLQRKMSLGRDPSLPPSTADSMNQVYNKFSEAFHGEGSCNACRRFDVVLSPTHIHFYSATLGKTISIARNKL